MSMEMTWLVDHQVLMVWINGPVTINDMHHSTQTLVSVLDQAGQRVHVLVDMSAAREMPLNLTLLAEVSRAFLTHPHLGWLINFGAQNRLQETISSILVQRFHKRYRQFARAEEALVFLSEVDPSLPALSRSLIRGGDESLTA